METVTEAKIVLNPTKPVNISDKIHTINAGKSVLGKTDISTPIAVPAPFPPLKSRLFLGKNPLQISSLGTKTANFKSFSLTTRKEST